MPETLPQRRSLVFLLCFLSTASASTQNWSDYAEPQLTSRTKLRTESTISPFSPGSHNLALDLGQVFLMGDLTRYSDSIGVQAHYNYGVSDLFSFDASLGYSGHSSRYSVGSLLAGMRMNLASIDKIVPYGTAGLGFYKPTYNDIIHADTATPHLTDTQSLSGLVFGLHLGVGADLIMSRSMFFGAAITFHNMFGTSASLPGNNTQIGINGSYVTFYLHSGVSF